VASNASSAIASVPRPCVRGPEDFPTWPVADSVAMTVSNVTLGLAGAAWNLCHRTASRRRSTRWTAPSPPCRTDAGESRTLAPGRGRVRGDQAFTHVAAEPVQALILDRGAEFGCAEGAVDGSLLLAECGPRRAFCPARAGPGLARLPQPGKHPTIATCNWNAHLLQGFKLRLAIRRGSGVPLWITMSAGSDARRWRPCARRHGPPSKS